MLHDFQSVRQLNFRFGGMFPFVHAVCVIEGYPNAAIRQNRPRFSPGGNLDNRFCKQIKGLTKPSNRHAVLPCAALKHEFGHFPLFAWELTSGLFLTTNSCASRPIALVEKIVVLDLVDQTPLAFFQQQAKVLPWNATEFAQTALARLRKFSIPLMRFRASAKILP